MWGILSTFGNILLSMMSISIWEATRRVSIYPTPVAIILRVIPHAAANRLMREDPKKFKSLVQSSICDHLDAIDKMCERGMKFWDYGNAFLLEAQRAGADIAGERGCFRYPSYVEDIMGPECFDYGFGPFRWVCASGQKADLRVTDELAAGVLRRLRKDAPDEIQQQYSDNLKWIEAAEDNNLVVGSCARILYADDEDDVLSPMHSTKPFAMVAYKVLLF